MLYAWLRRGELFGLRWREQAEDARERATPIAIMRMASHTNFATTQRYLDLADVLFGEEVSLLGKWYGHPGTNSGYKARSSDAVNGLAAGNDWRS